MIQRFKIYEAITIGFLFTIQSDCILSCIFSFILFLVWYFDCFAKNLMDLRLFLSFFQHLMFSFHD